MPMRLSFTRRRPRRTLAALVITGLLAGCGETRLEGCDREPPLSYENFGQGFLEKNCNGCHSSLMEGEARNGAPAGVDFDTYAGVVEWVERIEARAVVDQDMPPGGGPSPDELAHLSEWLSCEVKTDAALLAEQEGS